MHSQQYSPSFLGRNILAPEPDAAHRLVRLNWVSKQVAGAKLGTEGALVAGRLGLSLDFTPAERVANDKRVTGRKNDQAARGLRDRLVGTLGQASHHGPADQDSEIGDGGPARPLRCTAE